MSVRKARRKMLRWERWERKYEHLVPGLLCTPGSMAAYNRWVHARRIHRHLGR